MRDAEITSYWLNRDEPTTTFEAGSLYKLNFQESTIAALSNLGLPAQAAPFLSFNQSLAEFQTLDTWFQENAPHWQRFIIIGADGAGNPLVLDTAAQDQVLLMDHDNGFTTQLVTRSLSVLLACLVAYSQFVEEVVASRGNGAYLDANFTDAQFDSLQKSLRAIDSQTVERQGFWYDELASLLANREFYQKERNS